MTGCIVTTTKAGWNRPDTTYQGKRMRSHRAAWIKANGPIPEGMSVCHRCDNPLCVNPEHLFLGSHAENMADKQLKGREPRGTARPNAKMTEETAVCAMARLLAGESQRSVARAFGVTLQTIQQIWKGKTWGHVFAE